ncbi:MAG: SMC family ATPase, partial [Candidatus Aenigmarchaeota archaeon]|nr:SMC family ATPase [Candidatus Aenigmarchaeota archaeon]
MITSLKISGWRSHEESKFEFSRGTNVLVGVMGAGKSSILDAISFALFGTFPALQSRKVTLDDIIMSRPRKANKMIVSISFEMGRNQYVVKRIVERGKGTIESDIRENGKLMDTGSSRTTEAVEKILKVNYDLFSRAVYSEQNGLDYFLRLAKGQRMKKIDDLLQIDKFEKARSSVTSILNRIKNSIVDKTNIIEEIAKKENFERITDLKKEISEFEKEAKNLTEKLDSIKKK